ncbi:MAG TPA: SGNH/GDSL hydrolase family protein [Candidatus Latescibacteria bacterium]|nr:SGNH/GDSL hydrolase family protein [Candidatus Latescibacterota bacterium]HOS63321.1 SGNH/GDSL hydrolase family protein [Candidatus Latescibacterota bacterium]HPK74496.1 SGNH/GDSL hydrolase family protein [Candidatus Latescibacterota bacterium]
MGEIKDGQTLLFIGDSITDCGRRGPNYPLGDGYPALFRDLMTARWPERNIQYINKGIGGNRVTDLQMRWEDDVMRYKPEWLSIKIGINDEHSFVADPNNGVSPQRFREVYDSILQRTFSVWKPNLILISPFYISQDTVSGTHRTKILQLIPEYIAVVKDMAAKYNAIYVPLHDIFQKHLEYRDADTFCPEPVHPYRSGHIIIARAIMHAIDES